jgi:plasmid stability protein
MNTVQYTIRGIPEDVDKMIRKRAKREGKSFNKAVVELLEKGLFLGKATKSAENVFTRMQKNHVFDKGFYEAIETQSQIDEKLW